MKFIQEIKQSIYGPAYYRELLAQPLSYSFKYFFKLAVWVAFAFTIVGAFVAFPAIHLFFSNASEKVLSYYPQDLEIKVQQGLVSTNVKEPYFIKFPAELKGSVDQPEGAPDFDNLAVINTKDPFSIDAFKNYKTLVLITGDSLVTYKNSGITIQPLSNVSNFTLNKGKIVSFFEKARPYLRLAYPLIAVGLFLILFLAAVLKLAYMLLVAVFIWYMARVKKISIKYGKAYQLGLHLMTAPMILGALISALDPRTHTTFFFTLILLVLAWVNLKRPPEEAAAS